MTPAMLRYCPASSKSSLKGRCLHRNRGWSNGSTQWRSTSLRQAHIQAFRTHWVPCLFFIDRRVASAGSYIGTSGFTLTPPCATHVCDCFRSGTSCAGALSSERRTVACRAPKPSRHATRCYCPTTLRPNGKVLLAGPTPRYGVPDRSARLAPTGSISTTVSPTGISSRLALSARSCCRGCLASPTAVSLHPARISRRRDWQRRLGWIQEVLRQQHSEGATALHLQRTTVHRAAESRWQPCFPAAFRANSR